MSASPARAALDIEEILDNKPPSPAFVEQLNNLRLWPSVELKKLVACIEKLQACSDPQKVIAFMKPGTTFAQITASNAVQTVQTVQTVQAVQPVHRQRVQKATELREKLCSFGPCCRNKGRCTFMHFDETGGRPYIFGESKVYVEGPMIVIEDEEENFSLLCCYCLRDQCDHLPDHKDLYLQHHSCFSLQPWWPKKGGVPSKSARLPIYHAEADFLEGLAKAERQPLVDPLTVAKVANVTVVDDGIGPWADVEDDN